MGAAGVVSAPFLCFRAARGIEENLTQLVIGDVPLFAARPRPGVVRVVAPWDPLTGKDNHSDKKREEEPH